MTASLISHFVSAGTGKDRRQETFTRECQKREPSQLQFPPGKLCTTNHGITKIFTLSHTQNLMGIKSKDLQSMESLWIALLSLLSVDSGNQRVEAVVCILNYVIVIKQVDIGNMKDRVRSFPKWSAGNCVNHIRSYIVCYPYRQIVHSNTGKLKFISHWSAASEMHFVSKFQGWKVKVCGLDHSGTQPFV